MSDSMDVDASTENVSSRLTANDKTMDTLPLQPPSSTRTFSYKYCILCILYYVVLFPSHMLVLFSCNVTIYLLFLIILFKLSISRKPISKHCQLIHVVLFYSVDPLYSLGKEMQ